MEVAVEHYRAELRPQIPDEQEQRNADGPPLGGLIVVVAGCEVGARRVVRPAEHAGNHHALNGPRGIPERVRDLDRLACDVARRSILVEENGALVLGDNVEVLRKRSVGGEANSFLNTNMVPRPVEVICHGTRIRAMKRSRVPDDDLELVSPASAALFRSKSWTRRATAIVRRTRGPLPDLREGEKRE